MPDAESDVPVHACPPEGAGGVMPCCGRTPFEVRVHRITADPALVTCMTGSDPRIIAPAVPTTTDPEGA